MQLTSAVPQPTRSTAGLTRLHQISYRIWGPPESPVQIEYAPEVLHNALGAGVLFGIRQKHRLRILAARATIVPRDPLLVGLDPVGIFVTRPRGEVFLTELDLERLEGTRIPGAVALVVSGGKAGFFVPEPGGAIQAIRSYEEFSAQDRAHPTQPPAKPAISWHLRPLWLWFAVGALALLVAGVMTQFYWAVHTPLGLHVRADQGQFLITWSRDLRIGEIEIMDGDRISKVSVSPALTQVTYTPFTGDVAVQLTASSLKGHPRREIARFVAPETTPGP